MYNQFTIDFKGIKSLCQWLKKQESTFKNTPICLEHTVCTEN
jgi:hypothetical protein